LAGAACCTAQAYDRTIITHGVLNFKQPLYPKLEGCFAWQVRRVAQLETTPSRCL